MTLEQIGGAALMPLFIAALIETELDRRKYLALVGSAPVESLRCCAMLRHAAPCCAMLRHAAPGNAQSAFPDPDSIRTDAMPAFR